MHASKNRPKTTKSLGPNKRRMEAGTQRGLAHTAVSVPTTRSRDPASLGLPIPRDRLSLPQPQFYVPEPLSPRLPKRRYDPELEALRVSTKGLLVGRNRETGRNVRLDPEFFSTGTHFLGRTGSGKSRLMGWFFSLLAGDPFSTTIVIDAGKGSFYQMCRDIAIASGWTKRLLLMDLGDPTRRLAWDPMKPNGLPPLIHSKAVVETIRAACGQSDFTQTMQLHRHLTIGAGVSRLFEMGLPEAMKILEPGSKLRKSLLPRISDPYLKSSLAYLDSLSLSRQDQLVASSLARLESLVLDPVLRPILSHREHAIDISHVIDQRRIFCINLAKYDPLRKDDSKLFGRLILSDLVMKIYERFHHHRRTAPHTPLPPINIFIDEFQNIATFDSVDLVDESREMGAKLFFANQFLDQLRDEEKSGYLYHSAIADLRTKILFNAAIQDIETLSKDIWLDQWSPWMLKEELTALEAEPVLTTSVSRSRGRSGSRGQSLTHSQERSEADSMSETYGTNWAASRTLTETVNEATMLGTSRTIGAGHSHTSSDATASTVMDSVMHQTAEGVTAGSAHTEGVVDSDSRGITLTYQYDSPHAAMPDSASRSWQGSDGTSRSAQDTKSLAESRLRSDGTTHSEGITQQHGEADTISFNEALTESENRTLGAARSIGTSMTEGGSQASTKAHTTTLSGGVAQGTNAQEGWNESESVSPFTAYRCRRVPANRTFLSWEEFGLLKTQQAAGQGTAQCVVKAPGCSARFVEAPWFDLPDLSGRIIQGAHDRVYSQLGYFEVIESAPTTTDPRHQHSLVPARNGAAPPVIEQPVPDDPPPEEPPMPAFY